jgi:hypothetical protein
MILEDTTTEIAQKASETGLVLRLVVIADAPKGGEAAIFEEVVVS